MLTSHLFGDTAAPYIIGAVSDAIRGNVDTPEAQYISLVKSCSVTIVLISISGVFYMICATVLLKDQVKFKKEMATLDNVMRTLEWYNMGVKIDGRQIHHLRFADDIVLITPDISQAERMLGDFDKACGKIGLGLNLKKTMFMENGLVSFAPFTLNGTSISECSSYVYLGREINMMNDLASELSKTKRAAWGVFKSIEDVVKRTKNTQLRAHLFDSTVLPALTYA
uniref:Reverse transcriptase domain-containing protein n=1 Tax=Angiostrongylus cantonensis TaxID=6313 RepID=A0A0K0DNH3_ANGCA